MIKRTITDPNSEYVLQPGEELDLVYEVVGSPSDWWLGQFTGYVERRLQEDHPELDYLGFAVAVDGKELTFKFRQRANDRTDPTLPVQQASIGHIVGWLIGLVVTVGVALGATYYLRLRLATVISEHAETFKRISDDAVIIVAGLILLVLLSGWKLRL